jgi:hypothetical protein
MRFNLPFDPIPLKIAVAFAVAILGMLTFWAIRGFPEPWNGRGIWSAECAVFDYGCPRYLQPRPTTRPQGEPHEPR